MSITADKPRILVVEEEPEVLATMLYLLKRTGCEVVGAKTGAEGMQRILTGEFDLITLDIDLPDTNGLELCRLLKQDRNLCRIPVIFVSGRVSDGNREGCLELGAADYIVKPFDALVFIARIFLQLKSAT